MPRIRTIKPETPEDEKLGAVSRDARLLFILLWTKCDDHGRFRASPVWLRNNLFPYDLDTDVVTWLRELSAIGRVHLYRVDGESYGLVTNWAKHQRIDNAGKSLYPAPEDANDGEPGESPQSSASLGDPPLDLDLDLDLEGTGKPPQAAAVVPIASRLSPPSSFIEIVDPGGPVAVRRETTAILDAAEQRASDRLTPTERKILRPVVEEALMAQYLPDELADAIAFSPFRTRAAIMGELRKRHRPAVATSTRTSRSLERIAREIGEIA